MQTPPYTPIVRPRRSGDPEVELTGVTVLHRAMRGDATRMARLVRDVADGRLTLDRRRATALHTYLRAVTREIHGHHRQEDLNLWPLIAASAGAAVDLSPLIDDHAQLDPLLQRADAEAEALAAGPAAPEPAGRLATVLAELRDLLDEHIEEEEATAFTVLRRYVSVPDFEECERRIGKSTAFSRLPFLLPWVARHATPQELATMFHSAGLPMRLLLTATRRRYTALERSVFGGR